MKINFYELQSSKVNLEFVVIQARYKNKWIFVQHKERVTWEIPGGHIEENEEADSAAKRELWEESGALEFELIPICDYGAEYNGKESYGRLYFAEVSKLGELPNLEIHKVTLEDELPNELTYQEIQPYLYNKVNQFLTSTKKN